MSPETIGPTGMAQEASIPARPGTIRLFQFHGIVVFLHWSWLLVAAYEISARTGTYSTFIWNIVEYVGLFGIVTLHEFGHALACRSVGGRADQILLWPLGGIAFVDPPNRPGATLWSIAAGPLVNVALLPIFGSLAVVVSNAMSPDVHALLRSLALIDAGLLIFNLLPVYPLDGGQILGALLWFVIGRARSLLVTALLGFVGVAGIAWLAMSTASMWLGIVAFFVAQRCLGSLRLAQALKRAVDAPRREGFACPSCHAAPPIGPFWPCASCGIAFDPLDAAPPGVPVVSDTTTLNLSAAPLQAGDVADTVGRCGACQAEATWMKCFRCDGVTSVHDWKVSVASPAGFASVTRPRRPSTPSISPMVLGVCLAIVALMAWFVSVNFAVASRNFESGSAVFARGVAIAAFGLGGLPAIAAVWLFLRYRRSTKAFQVAVQRFHDDGDLVG